MTCSVPRARLPLLAVISAIALFGCDQNTPEKTSTATEAEMSEQRSLSGEVLYRERIAMPAGARVTVKLEDVSLADAPSIVIAEQQIDQPGQVPVPFTLHYRSDAIVLEHPMAYAVRAEIRGDEGQLLWTTTERHTVELAGDASNAGITIVVQRVAN